GEPAAKGAAPARAALKGTMVGVAPPAVGAAVPPQAVPPQQGGAAGAEPRPAAARPAMKGTMIGLAPPSLGTPGAQDPSAQGPTTQGPRQRSLPPSLREADRARRRPDRVP